MTDEERQRQMDFIVNQQAQFDADMQKTDERMKSLREMQQRNEEKWARTEEGIRSLLARVIKRRNGEGQGEQTG